MFKSGAFWLAVCGALLLGLYQTFTARLLPMPGTGLIRQFLITEIGIIGFALLAAAVLVFLVNKTHKRTREWPSTILARGATFGICAGALVAVMFPAPPTPEDIAIGSDGVVWFYRLQRILGFAGLMGGGIYLILHLVAHSTSGHLVSRTEQIIAMAVGFSAVFVCGLWGAMELPRIGGALCQVSLGVIDWVGAGVGAHGKCDTTSLNARSLQPRVDIPQIAAAMLGFYFLFVACYENGKWRLSFARSIMVIGGAIVAGFTLFEVVAALNADTGAGQPRNRFIQFGPFLLGMALYAALFSFWMTWSRHHSLVESLCEAFGSTDAFRGMIESRIRPNYEVPPRGLSLFSDVRNIVDRAEDNGWIGGLLVHARRSRPDHLALARVADRYGLGIDLPKDSNIEKVAKGLAKSTKGETSEEKLESIIRQFSKLGPAAHREQEARLEARICRIITPRNEGTGWLVAPDLVMTNFHVVEQMTGETPSLRGRDVVCQFDYKESGGSIIKGTECTLHPEKPVVDYSPYSRFDLSESEELPAEDELDFALLRLDRRMGELPIGGVGEDGAPHRGWISLKRQMESPDPDAKTVEDKILLYVLQHPYGGPLKAECGALTEVNANRTRIRHDATTERGSSGSPCFNFSDLEPIALHHAGKHSRTLNKPFNQAIPISRILRFLRDRGKVEAFWELSPGGSEKPFVKAVRPAGSV